MMNAPFFRSYSNQQPSLSSRSFPVHQQTPQRSSPPKVVSVPIHFVSSDQPRTTMSMLKDSAALKIQKLFRGFVVRKIVRKIASIGTEVSEIERRIIDDVDAVDLIRRDAKERLRVNETLMSLLFKLDSIRGVDCGIRDLRKAVTRKAIALQEKVDSIAQIDHQTLDSPEDDSGEIEQVTGVKLEAIEADDEDVVKEVVEDSNAPAKDEDVIDDDDVQKKQGDCARNYEKENREIIENLVEDNEKMRRVMGEISERNEMQTRMINSLSRRVEQLEKALVARKRKKPQVCLRRREKGSFTI